MFKCSPVPASFFPYLLTSLHWCRSPGGRANVTPFVYTGRRRREPANIQNTFNQINKHNRKAAAPHGRLPQTKHKLKSRPGPLSSSTVVTPPFIPSEAPPWDSRPVSGAGVVHYHSLHRPRSVPTALGPAPLVTNNIVVNYSNLHVENMFLDFFSADVTQFFFYLHTDKDMYSLNAL